MLLAVTRGFGDALRIGTQERPDIFAREIVLPEPLSADVVEIAWPSGTRETLRALPANQAFVIHEGKGVVAREGLRRRER